MDLLSQMSTFVRVVDGKSLSAAARAERLSLPAVSRKLAALEHDLGVTLVVRSTRRLHVTEAGRAFYERCLRVLREVDEARSEVKGTKAVAGSLVVSASLTFGLEILMPAMAKLAAAHPRLVLDVRLEDALVDLVAEGVDVAVRAGSPPPESTAYVAHPIFSMSRVLVASPKWIRQHKTPRQPADLVRHPCLMQVTTRGTPIKWLLVRGDVSLTPEVAGNIRTNAPIALRDLARGGAGVAYLPDWLVADDIARGTLRRVLEDWASPPIRAWAIHRAELRGAPRLRALLDALPRSP